MFRGNSTETTLKPVSSFTKVLWNVSTILRLLDLVKNLQAIQQLNDNMFVLSKL